MNKLIGTVESVSEAITLERALKPDILKRILTVASDTGEIAFFEVRDACMSRLEKLQVDVGDSIEVFFQLKGSKNGAILHNNVVATDIILIKRKID